MSTGWPHDQQELSGPRSQDEDPWPTADRDDQPRHPSGPLPVGKSSGRRSGRKGRRAQADDSDEGAAAGGAADDEDYEWIRYLTGGRSSSPAPAGDTGPAVPAQRPDPPAESPRGRSGRGRLGSRRSAEAEPDSAPATTPEASGPRPGGAAASAAPAAFVPPPPAREAWVPEARAAEARAAEDRAARGAGPDLGQQSEPRHAPGARTAHRNSGDEWADQGFGDRTDPGFGQRDRQSFPAAWRPERAPDVGRGFPGQADRGFVPDPRQGSQDQDDPRQGYPLQGSPEHADPRGGYSRPGSPAEGDARQGYRRPGGSRPGGLDEDYLRPGDPRLDAGARRPTSGLASDAEPRRASRHGAAQAPDSGWYDPADPGPASGDPGARGRGPGAEPGAEPGADSGGRARSGPSRRRSARRARDADPSAAPGSDEPGLPGAEAGLSRDDSWPPRSDRRPQAAVRQRGPGGADDYSLAPDGPGQVAAQAATVEAPAKLDRRERKLAKAESRGRGKRPGRSADADADTAADVAAADPAAASPAPSQPQAATRRGGPAQPR